MLWIGLASALVGAILSLGQRHIKRLLAFSTISHAGFMLTGLSLMSRDGAAGLLAYLAGHGMVKGAMFMLAGFIAAKCGGIEGNHQLPGARWRTCGVQEGRRVGGKIGAG